MSDHPSDHASEGPSEAQRDDPRKPARPEPGRALRLHVDPALPLAAGLEFDLPEAAVRHAQVRRVQPGDPLLLFDGRGSDWPALVLAVGRSSLRVRLAQAAAAPAHTLELPQPWTLALVMPANERMDALVEKATELGAARIVPLMAERSVLRLHGERAQRRQAHWQGVAVAACEQCGRSVVPEVAAVQNLQTWLQGLPPQLAGVGGVASGVAGGAADGEVNAGVVPRRWLLSLRHGALPLAQVARTALQAAGTGASAAAGVGAGADLSAATVTLLSGPEGGFSAEEEAAAQRHGFVPVSLGARVLRADTAPLAALAWWGVQSGQA